MNRVQKILFPQFVGMGLPVNLHSVACLKIEQQIFDAGNLFNFQEEELDDENECNDGEECDDATQSDCEQDVPETIEIGRRSLCANENLDANMDVFLVDHMWTTTFPQSRRHLLEHNQLRQRIAAMMDLPLEEETDDKAVQSNADSIWESIWPALNCYTVSSDEYTKWYLMDEVGCAIRHSSDPNFKCCPLIIDMGDETPAFALSIMWSIAPVEAGDVISRDFLAGVPKGPSRDLRLLAFLQPPLLGSVFKSGGNAGSLCKEGRGQEAGDVGDAGDDDDDEDITRYLSRIEKVLASIDDNRVHESDKSSELAIEREDAAVEYADPDGNEAVAWSLVSRRWEPIEKALAALWSDSKEVGAVDVGRYDRQDRVLKVFCDRPDHLSAEMLEAGPGASALAGTGGGRGVSIELVPSAVDADVLYLIDHTFTMESTSSSPSSKPKATSEPDNVHPDAPSTTSAVGGSGSGGGGGGDGAGAVLEYNKSGKMINQFCWDGMLVTKDQLVRTVRAAHEIKHSRKSKSKHNADANVGSGAGGSDDGAATIGAAAFSSFPPWLPASYDLETLEGLASYIRDYTDRQKRLLSFQREGRKAPHTDADTGIDTGTDTGTDANIWILKRDRGRQSIDYPITRSLSCALRHMEAGPRVACSYVTDPVLLRGRKFDLRFYVLVTSLAPLTLSRYRHFVVRSANTQYDLTDLESYQKHFTLMSFLEDDDEFSQVRGRGHRDDPAMEEFLRLFDEEHGARSADGPGTEGREGGSGIGAWNEHVQPQIDKVLREVFQCAGDAFAHLPPYPSTEPLHPNSGWSLNQPNRCPARGMFGVDIILRHKPSCAVESNDGCAVESRVQPMVLEVQWAPDCQRALKFVPSFWNEILAALYLQETSNVVPL